MPVEIIRVPNYSEINLIEKTTLAVDSLLGQPNLTLLNTDGFATNDIINIGALDSNIAEIGVIGSISGQIVTMNGNLVLNHKKYELFTKLFGDNLKLYRASNIDGNIPQDTSFTFLNTTPLNPSQSFTQVQDNAGGDSFWYKVTYYSSTNLNETSLAASIALRGGGFGNYASLEEIKDEAGISRLDASMDSMISLRRAQAQDEINARLVSAGYLVPLQTELGVFYVPPMINILTVELSAGLILKKNFGITKPGSSKNGEVKVDEARQVLAEIQLNDAVLLDATGQPLAKTSLVDGWPDDTTTVRLPTGRRNTGPIFTMDKEF